MQNRIEPPVLLSRLLTFVLAGALVVLITLIVTLYKMFPINRPQVFFLSARPQNDLQIILNEIPPTNKNMDWYKRSFIREYIRVRNEIVPNISEMHNRWSNNAGGLVRAWSTTPVFQEFTQTKLWAVMMNNVLGNYFTCRVEFKDGALTPRTHDTYSVEFKYFCTDISGQEYQKDYTIVIKLEQENTTPMKWFEILDNPLGLRVSEYKIESDNGDPLNIGYQMIGNQNGIY